MYEVVGVGFEEVVVYYDYVQCVVQQGWVVGGNLQYCVVQCQYYCVEQYGVLCVQQFVVNLVVDCWCGVDQCCCCILDQVGFVVDEVEFFYYVGDYQYLYVVEVEVFLYFDEKDCVEGVCLGDGWVLKGYVVFVWVYVVVLCVVMFFVVFLNGL